MLDRNDKGHRRDASQYFIAGELCRRGMVAGITLGNCPNTDILCSDAEGKRFVHIQVKTFRPGDKTCSVGMKAEIDYGNTFFWILGGIPLADSKAQFIYYIVPSSVMSRKVRAEFQAWVEAPGKKKPHDPKNTVRTIFLPPHRQSWLSEYQDRWDLIEEKLIK